jgi:glycosyltransferase involved in cell wall biosynthesis
LRTLELIESLAAAYDVSVVVDRPGPLLGRIVGHSSGVMVGPFASLAERAKVVAGVDPDVVLAVTMLSYEFAVAAQSLGIPTVMEIHESQTPAVFFYSVRGSQAVSDLDVARFCGAVHASDAVIAANPAQAEMLRAAGAVNLLIVPTIPKVAPNGARPRSDPPLPRYAICVGAGAPLKGQYLLIRALERLDDPPPLALIGCGDSSYVRGLAELLRRGPLPGWVLRERVDSVDGWYRRAAIAVSASYSETYPGSLIEAAGHGLPIVATDLPGTRAALGAYSRATYCDPGSISDLAEAIDSARRLTSALPANAPSLDATDRIDRITQILARSIS